MMLGPLEKALLAVLMFVLMFGMGAGLTVAIRDVVRRPFAPLIGLASHERLLWLPLLDALLVLLSATGLTLWWRRTTPLSSASAP